MIEVRMPQLGESVAEGTVTEWKVREGDGVEREQVLLTVATDKADTEIRSPATGRVARLVAKPNEIVAKGGLLCEIEEGAQGTAAPKAAAAVEAPKAEPKSNGGPAGLGLASPSTRQYAREQGVDIQGVKGTGEGGRVTQQDVQRAKEPAPASTPRPHSQNPPAPRPPPAQPQAATPLTVDLASLVQAGGGFVPPIPGVGYGSYKVPAYNPRPGDEVIPFNRRRRITADHMVYSKVVSPHVVTVAEVDLAATSKLRDLHKDRLKKEGIPLTFLGFICAATVKALREHPALNARVIEGAHVILKEINLGVAVETPGGLVVPSVKHADQLSLRGLAATIDELATRARAGKVTADDLSGTSFSVSNPGLKGNLFGGAIISQPNVGILRMGEIKKRPVVVTRDGEDAIAIHPVMFMALSYDHRVVDGVLANSFLWRVGDILSRAEFEVG